MTKILSFVTLLLFLATTAQAVQPNLLVIITDQQSGTMLSCAGNKYLKTPNMDSLADVGTRFERAYATNPVCLPARFSFLTGHYPGEVGIRSNPQRAKKDLAPFAQKALGNVLRKAGYRTVFGGKRHLPGLMGDVKKCGFEYLTPNERDGLAQQCAKFLQEKQEKPFLLVAMLINPHDICYQAIRAHDPKSRLATRTPAPLDEALKLPPGMSEKDFFAKVCPPLPANFEPTDKEPDAYAFLLNQRKFRLHARDNWGEKEWRMHRWAYCRLTERVDQQIGVILDALRKSEYADDTAIFFTSDHGDLDGAHRFEHKTLFYEESARVPMILCPPKSDCPSAQVDDEHLVSVGLDLFPTLCDYAQVKPPAGLRGKSLRPLACGKTVEDWRKALLIENEIGDAIVSGPWKYAEFFVGEKVTRTLFNLQDDPGEMRNLAYDAKYAGQVKKLSAKLQKLKH